MIPRPDLHAADAEELAARHYAFPGRARELPSERDRNFQLVAEDGRGLLLKVAREDEPDAVRDLQTRALEWLHRRDPGLPVPRPLRTQSGEDRFAAADRVGASLSVRALSWMPGRVLAKVRPQHSTLLHELGRVLGRLDAGLQDFQHEAMDRPLDWHAHRALEQLPALLEGLDPTTRELARPAFERAADRVRSAEPSLRRSVLHHDANDHNVLVSERPGAASISGLLDFGDMGRSWTAAEPAVAIAYAMMDKRDPIAAAAAVMAGYQSTWPLREEEVEVVGDLAVLRLLTTLGMAARQRAAEPDNAYLSISEDGARTTLRSLAPVEPARFAARLRDAAGFEATRNAVAVREYLASHPAAPVVDAELDRDGVVHELDLSVGSPDLAALDDPDLPTLSRWIEDEIARHGASVGWGRYDEARTLYAAEGFVEDCDEGDAARRIHIGVDLFQPAGSPVRAAYDGVVHGFARNDRPLDYGPTILLRHDPPDGPRFFTLYGHLSLDSLDGLERGAVVRAGQEIARMGSAEVNGGWPPHLHFQVMTDLHGETGDFPGVARAAERRFWKSMVPDPGPALRPSHATPTEPGPDSLLPRRRRSLGPSLSLSYSRPLHMVRGRGQSLYDVDGRRYLDAVNNVPHVGHCHPRVVRAIQRQAATLATNTRYLHEQLACYAERLLSKFPAPLEVCYFVCSGSEANELALRLARTHTGGEDVMVLDGAYHGNSGQLVDLSPYKFDGPGGRGAAPWVWVLPMPDPYRGLYRHGDADLGRRYAGHVDDALARIAAAGGRAAALIAEPLLGCGGQIVPPEGFLPEAFARARSAGALTIADEVQVGFGRVGSHFWAFDAQAAAPDIVTLGKPIGNGHPLGAVVTTRAIAESFDNGMEYFNTFGGNPVSCAAGLAVLDVIEEEGLQQNALEVGEHLQEGLRRIQEDCDWIGEVRGRGLYLGVELVRDRRSLEPAAAEASHVVERLKDRGILISTDGPLHNVLKIKPPLVFGRDDADRLLGALEEVLQDSVLRR